MTSDKASKRSPWISYIGLMLSTFIMIEATAFQIPALPTIVNYFGVQVALAGLAGLAYSLTTLVLGPVFGNIADQVGRKKILLIGMIVFSVSEFIAAVSTSWTIFVSCRLLQGVGVAAVIPATIAYAGVLFKPEKRGVALGVQSASGSFGAAVGGGIAGPLINNFGWQSIYIFTGSLAIIGFIVVWFTLPETQRKEREPFDFFGSFLLMVTGGFLLSVSVIMSVFGRTSSYSLFSYGMGILLLICFLQWEKRHEHPFLDMNLLTDRRFILPALFVFFVNICWTAYLYTCAFFVSNRPGGGPQYVGIVLLGALLTGTLVALISGKLADSFRPKTIIMIDLCILLAGTFAFTRFASETPFWYVLMTGILVGGGYFGMHPCVIKLAYSAFTEKNLGTGTGTYLMIREFGIPTGSVISLAVFGAISASALVTSITAVAQNAGIGDKLMPAVIQAAETGGKTMSPDLVAQFDKMGINFNDMYNEANVVGMVQAINTVSYFIVGLAILLFVVAVTQLPGAPDKVTTKKIEEL